MQRCNTTAFTVAHERRLQFLHVAPAVVTLAMVLDPLYFAPVVHDLRRTPWPLIEVISDSGSLFIRSCAQAASIGRPLLSTSNGNIAPSDRLALCEIASTSLPARRWASIHAQRSSG